MFANCLFCLGSGGWTSDAPLPPLRLLYCRVEDIASSHAGSPAFGGVLSTGKAAPLGQHRAPVHKTHCMMPCTRRATLYWSEIN